MDPTTTAIITSLATNYFTHFSAPAIESFFKKVFNIKPSLENDLKKASKPEDFERIFNEAVGVIDAQANTGTIEVDKTFLEALRGIRFDHQHGQVNINGSIIQAPILQTGGTGSGRTEIFESNLKSNGTEIKMGKGCGIIMNGNAQIRQN